MSGEKHDTAGLIGINLSAQPPSSLLPPIFVPGFVLTSHAPSYPSMAQYLGEGQSMGCRFEVVALCLLIPVI